MIRNWRFRGIVVTLQETNNIPWNSTVGIRSFPFGVFGPFFRVKSAPGRWITIPKWFHIFLHGWQLQRSEWLVFYLCFRFRLQIFNWKFIPPNKQYKFNQSFSCYTYLPGKSFSGRLLSRPLWHEIRFRHSLLEALQVSPSSQQALGCVFEQRKPVGPPQPMGWPLLPVSLKILEI